ncbi:MAG: hypothetical protein N3G20_10530 [Verrucomicrobiae bacterium]|nr:hypothetical protein [Verrucomicrobiae bacterium]
MAKSAPAIASCLMYWTTAYATPVTFNVNMSIQRTMGSFDPEGRGDTVLVVRNWDG